MDSGVSQLNSNAFFIDPVRILNRSYTRFRVSPSTYYSRFFDSLNSAQSPKASEDFRKRKRKRKKKIQSLNEREQIADRRHQVPLNLEWRVKNTNVYVFSSFIYELSCVWVFYLKYHLMFIEITWNVSCSFSYMKDGDNTGRKR